MGHQRPSSGELIGRDDEVSTVTRLLAGRVRLVTLTGPPGVGKTRLAVDVSAELEAGYRDGVAFIDLTAARDEPAAISELARSLGIGGPGARASRDDVHAWLADQHQLLVLDNAEQVAGLADEVAALLADCPRVQLLVTSRENLHLSAEHELSVPPLAMPRPDDVFEVARLAENPAVRMFVSCAAEVDPTFAVTAENAAAVAEICVRLDGLPLALRLAAARVKVFSPADIAARIRDRRAILEATALDVPARHRSLRAAISWSHDVLDERERAVFRQLSVFSGSWPIDAAALVCDVSEADLVTTLSSLVDKSLIQRAADDEQTRLTMLESLREFAAEQLDQHGERSAATGRLADWCVSLAAAAEASLVSAREGIWWSAAAEHENDLKTTRAWAIQERDLNAALTLTAGLSWSHYLRGEVGSGLAAVEETLSLVEPSEQPVDRTALTAVRIVGGVLYWARGDLDTADELVTSALADCEERGDSRRQAMALAFVGHIARDRGHYDAAHAAHQAAADLYDRLDSGRGSAWARFDLGRVAWQRGDLEAASSLLRDALARFRVIGYPWAIGWISWALGAVTLRLGRTADGAALLVSAMDEFETVADRRGVAMCWEALASAAIEQDRPADGMRLLGAAAQLRIRLAAPATDLERADIDEAESRAYTALGDHRADAERSAGRDLPHAGVVQLARETGGPNAIGSLAAAVTSEAGLLTPRERQVATLVATGCTNQQIGSRLGITARTAEAHVHNIMGKLDAGSRAEIAAWAVTHGLHRA